MSLRTHIAANSQRSRMQIEALLKELNEAAQAAVLIVPTYGHVVRYRKYWVQEPFMFGLTVTTLSSWITDLWALYGDGRALVSSLERELLLYDTLSSLIEQGMVKQLALTPGTVKMLSSMAGEAFAFLLDKRVVVPASYTLTGAENEVCFVMKKYAETLEKQSLCEIGQAMDELASSDLSFPPLVFGGFDDFNPAETRFIEYASKKTSIQLVYDEAKLPVKADDRAKELVELQQCIFDPDPDDPVRPTGAVRFLFPSGKYAKPRLLRQVIISQAEAKLAIVKRMSSRRVSRESETLRFVVSTRDPLDLFSRLSPSLTPFGVNTTVRARKQFSATDFGKAFIALLEFMYAPSYTTFLLSDFIFSSFSAIPQKKAYALDARWRGDRTTDKARCLSDLSHASEHGEVLVTALQENGPLQVLTFFEGFAKQRFEWSESYRSEQLSAISLAIRFFEAAGAADLPFFDVLPLLAKSSVECSLRMEATHGDPVVSQSVVVDIMSLEEVAELDACSADMLILCDLESYAYPVKDADDAKTLLFEKLGFLSREDVLVRARRQFFRVLSVPQKKLVCERVLNTVDADTAYPAVMLEELVDCYRSDLSSVSDTDKRTGLPKVLLPYVEVLGEDQLYKNLTAGETEQLMQSRVALRPQGHVGESAQKLITLAPQGQGFGDVDKLYLSPSAIESYLECPYKWFSLRRIRLEEPDAGFGPMEMGSFSHAVLKAFYLGFQKQGFSKVGAVNLDSAKALLAELFDQQVELQPELRRNDNPLIPLTSLEKEEVKTLKKKLLGFLDREAELLPGFVPRHFELNFGDGGTFEYAGCLLRGTIDRIDVNNKGQAVVIDYKGSVSKDHALSSSSELTWVEPEAGLEPLTLPHKVQTLLYAQVARRVLGLDVVGALYVSYGRDGKVSGAYDPTVLGPAELLGIDAEACSVAGVCPDGFNAYLDKVEATIAQALEQLGEGFIVPSPRGTDPCGFCPVTACESRKRV